MGMIRALTLPMVMVAVFAAGCAGSPTTTTNKQKSRDDQGKKTPKENPNNPKVLVKTSMGDFTIALFEAESPITVTNFLKYVDAKHYDGTIFHRVMDGFMIQGGGFRPGLKKVSKNEGQGIKNEADNRLSNERGTIAMARSNDPDSATDQFFINVVDNAKLDHKGPGRQFGYCVFGKVIDGMGVVDKIKAVEVHDRGPNEAVPDKDVVVESIRRAKK
jgi:cyclophilin family peptidyl-prolyl cis-trans isomerase